MSYRNDNPTISTLKSLPNFEVENLRHLLMLPDDADVDKEKCKESLLEIIKTNHMYPYYERIKPKLGIIEDDFEIESFKEINSKKLAEFDEKIEFAEKNFGSSEIKDAILDKGNYYFKIGDHENTVRVYESSLQKTVGINSKLEIVLAILRAAFFFNDLPLLTKYIARAKEDIEKGGDWELRNRLNIYEAIQLMLCRKFKLAAELFLNSLSTFNATELITLDELVLYAIVLSIITMDRNVIKKKLLDSTEVLQVTSTNSNLYQFIYEFYNCNYKNFMFNLVEVSKLILKDRYIGRYYKYFVRQCRLPAYKQFLIPYKSVTLLNMSKSFQLTPEFLEQELLSYISNMKLDCKIDKINGIIENNIIDERNNKYIYTIQQGDLLINRIQKLSRIIDM